MKNLLLTFLFCMMAFVASANIQHEPAPDQVAVETVQQDNVIVSDVEAPSMAVSFTQSDCKANYTDYHHQLQHVAALKTGGSLLFVFYATTKNPTSRYIHTHQNHTANFQKVPIQMDCKIVFV